MKKAEECNTIEDVRTCIDAIDREIVKLLGIRAGFVKNAAKYKTSLDNVRAHERVEMMIKTRRNWASETDLDQDFIESIFRNIVSYFIGNEIKEWSKEN